MKEQDLPSNVKRTGTTVALILLCVCASSAATETILHNFSILPHGSNPVADLIADASGNLYGTTSNGGYGVVFELTPATGGKWTQTILHTFVGSNLSGSDGAYPAAGLIFDPAGDLYGTTSQGGTYGLGTVFKLTRTSGGRWKETVIHQFAGYPDDGANPVASLVFDSTGNLYGTTEYGGSGGGCGDQYRMVDCGTVFELSPAGDGWTETVLYNFQGGPDGCSPVAPVILDNNGNVYGTTQLGGISTQGCYLGAGTVFKLSPNSSGTWTESVPYAFTGGSDGGNPVAGLLFDSAGNLYGTTQAGGIFGGHEPKACNICGVIFELSPGTGGTWTESVLYSFTGASDGGGPAGNLVFDPAGNLFGTTVYGGSSTNCSSSGCGAIFALLPGSGGWTESVLYSFTGGGDGANPSAGLLLDQTGSLYTAASYGANSGCNPLNPNSPGCGAVVKLTASSRDKWTVGVVYDFPSPDDGISPFANLISDAAGRLYGTTQYGGTGQCYSIAGAGCGTVFELSLTAKGKWKRKVLYSFTGNHGDGANPTSGLIFDLTGNLYGTTQYGGNNACNGGYPYGTVFKLSPSPKGAWTETVIHAFGNNEGYRPTAGLALDSSGALYGTTSLGGSGDGGDVFQLVHTREAGWQENILYSFGQQYAPQGALVLDKEGNLYGTTRWGGSSQQGAVFKLSRSLNGWTESVLHSFSGSDGWWPMASLIFDQAGNLYGTTWMGGLYDGGVVFKLTRISGSTWTESVLYSFIGVNGDGAYPASTLIFDTLGNLYGTTASGGTNGGGCGRGLGCGTAFELIASSDGKWKERVLHRFTGGLDGGQPYAGFILDPAGNLYATASSGGAAGQGAVFKITQ
jgi:uncharacterized repeat protein (TIGR03803 family)